MGAVLFTMLLAIGCLVMGLLGYATGYHDGLNKRDDLIEEEESEKEIDGGIGPNRSTKRIDFNMWSDR